MHNDTPLKLNGWAWPSKILSWSRKRYSLAFWWIPISTTVDLHFTMSALQYYFPMYIIAARSANHKLSARSALCVNILVLPARVTGGGGPCRSPRPAFNLATTSSVRSHLRKRPRRGWGADRLPGALSVWTSWFCRLVSWGGGVSVQAYFACIALYYYSTAM